jgi:hypothetical protein
MSKTSVGLLAEHLLCLGDPVHAHALPADDALALFLLFDTNGVDYVGIPFVAEDAAAIIVFADQPFDVERPVLELRNVTRARGRQSGKLDASQAAAKLLFAAHSALAGPARFSDRWGRIAAGVEDGMVHGVCGG